MKIEKKKQNNKKFIMFGLIGLFAVALVSAGVVYYQTINVDITVDEALSALPLDISVIGAYPGETIVKEIVVNNLANVDLYTELTWAETTNDNLVAYAVDGALSTVQTIKASGDTTLVISFTLAEDSVLGTFTGTVVFDRVAKPIV